MNCHRAVQQIYGQHACLSWGDVDGAGHRAFLSQHGVDNMQIHTAWQSNDMILTGGLIMLRRSVIDIFFFVLVQCRSSMKCWGAGAITESSAPPLHWPFCYFLLFSVKMSLPQQQKLSDVCVSMSLFKASSGLQGREQSVKSTHGSAPNRSWVGLF